MFLLWRLTKNRVNISDVKREFENLKAAYIPKRVEWNKSDPFGGVSKDRKLCKIAVSIKLGI